jgi:replication fork protection complex subunit Tof1/Swi1
LNQELKELDELDEIGRMDYTTLLNSHVAYKRSMVNNPKAFIAILNVILPPLSKTGLKERTPRDEQIISLALHLIRNLAFIRSDQSEFVVALSSSHLLDLLLTMASNAMHNNIVLDIFHLIFCGIPPNSFPASTQQTSSAQTVLGKALRAEETAARQKARHANSRHNRFGTTIAVKQHNASFIIHKQSAIKKDPGELLDETKKATRRRTAHVDEDFEPLTYEASNIMRKFCQEFVELCFNSNLSVQFSLFIKLIIGDQISWRVS